jgi:hypothetical protein
MKNYLLNDLDHYPIALPKPPLNRCTVFIKELSDGILCGYVIIDGSS